MPAIVSVEGIYQAKLRLRGVINPTPLQHHYHLSERYGCKLYLKREDLQVVRSYKIRGAYNKMATLPQTQLKRGVVCASAGNHAQGVALACQLLGVRGVIFMPEVTPAQKVEKVRLFGKEQVEVRLWGDTFDDAFREAREFARNHRGAFIHPFDDARIIEGQGTIGAEILEECPEPLDYLLLPVGGGGLAAGVGAFFHQTSPHTKIIGVEPAGAPAMTHSIERGERVLLKNIDTFVDGAAVRQVGELTFPLCRATLNRMLLVPEGKVCSTILQLYNGEGIVVEPAGALSIAALDQLRDEIQGKTVVCIISGSNNDITRTEEIRERSLLYEGLKHYFIIRFPQRAGALRQFLNNVLGPTDDITHFEYTKKHNRESGPALVGIQVQKRQDYERLLQRMDAHGVHYQTLNDNPMLFEMLV
ncbi:MAG: threonine ammonia-lyase [Bacteroidetes bacterium]|nr:MAG: threonine ammonia-lyase [Bacteroidota bacterium]